jgi:thiol-disulfide isomerase/thioredoxin
MSRKYLIPIALIFILVLAACGPQQTAETSASAAAAADSSTETMPEEQSDSMAENNDESMESMDVSDSDSMDDMAEMEDDTMDDSHDDMATMDVSGSDTMDDGHDETATMDVSGSDTRDDSHDEMEASDSSDMASEDESMEDNSAAMMDLPLWQTLPITDVATGETFTLGDFQGKTVFVEPMATWCSNCRTQQGNVIQAKTQVGDDVVFIGLGLETTLPDEDLARYAKGNSFDWTYAVMSEELLSGLADEFGRSITSAPSTPHFIIRADGSFTELSTGIDSPTELVTKIQEAQS